MALRQVWGLDSAGSMATGLLSRIFHLWIDSKTTISDTKYTIPNANYKMGAVGWQQAPSHAFLITSLGRWKIHQNPSSSQGWRTQIPQNTNRWAIWLICFNCLNWTTYFQVSLVYFGVHWVVTIFTSGGGGGEEDCLYVGVPPRLPPPPWSTAPITIPSSHTWTLRCGILDDEHWCFWQRFHCQMSAIHTLLIMVACSLFLHLQSADVKCWRNFPFLALAKKKSLWRWRWLWYYIADIYNKNHHSHSVCGKLS